MSIINKLSEQQINNILNENLDEHSWLFQLGVSSKDDFSNTDNDFSFNFYEKGIEIWEKYKPLVKSILCDKERKVIKNTIDEGILGNVRELVLFIYFELSNTHNIAASIAVPLVAIVIKYKLQDFCSA